VFDSAFPDGLRQNFAPEYNKAVTSDKC
jgi:hypothetical protein